MVPFGQTALGLLGAWVVYRIDPDLALWMSPILAGLILSIPLAHAIGSPALGLAFRRAGIFETPEESRPPPELTQLAQAMARRRSAVPPVGTLQRDSGFLRAVVDPFVNAVHVSLIREKGEAATGSDERFAVLRTKLLRDGPGALAPRDRMAVLMDANSMHVLHRDVWSAPGAELAEAWRCALEKFG
jgi:membrane glycosyltransferase